MKARIRKTLVPTIKPITVIIMKLGRRHLAHLLLMNLIVNGTENFQNGNVLWIVMKCNIKCITMN